MRYSHTDTENSHVEVNLTPLIDLVFILLIFFLVTASFQQNTVLDIQRPQAQTVRLPNNTPSSIIEIAANGALRLDKQAVTVTQLRGELAQLQQATAPLQVIIVADQQAQTGLLVQVMDQARLAGIRQIALAADSDG